MPSTGSQHKHKSQRGNWWVCNACFLCDQVYGISDKSYRDAGLEIFFSIKSLGSTSPDLWEDGDAEGLAGVGRSEVDWEFGEKPPRWFSSQPTRKLGAVKKSSGEILNLGEQEKAVVSE